jgi:hypothetical protein
MRGLAQPPDTVARLTVDVLADGARSSTGWWLYSPFWATALPSDLYSTLAQLNFAVVSFVNACTAAAASCNVLRLTTYRSDQISIVTGTAPNLGAWGGMTPNNVATAVHWLTGDRGSGGQCITYMPAFPDDFTDDHLTVNDTGVTNVRNAAGTFLNAVPTCTSPTISSLALATLHRARAGVPLVTPTVSLIEGANVALKIGRCSRRLYATR